MSIVARSGSPLSESIFYADYESGLRIFLSLKLKILEHFWVFFTSFCFYALSSFLLSFFYLNQN